MKTLITAILLLSLMNLNAQFISESREIRYITGVSEGADITSDLTKAIFESSDGDVIVLPRGVYLISYEVNLGNKAVSILGYGSGENGTTLRRAENASFRDYTGFLLYLNAIDPAGSLIVVSGIRFQSEPSSRYSGGEEIDHTDYGIEFDRTPGFIVSDNVFEYFGVAGIGAYHADNIPGFNGLVFNNSFLDFYRPEIGNYGYGILIEASYGQHKQWISNPEFGSEKFVFIEDNFFRNTRHAIAAGSNGKYVFRYNIIEDNWKSPPIDMHGAGNFGNSYSARASEVYNNRMYSKYDIYGNLITGSTPSNHYPTFAMGIRGGEALIFENTISEYQYIGRFLVENPTPGAYPSPYQIGYLSGARLGETGTGSGLEQGDGDVYMWGNTQEKEFEQWEEVSIDPNDTELLHMGRDIHLNVEKPGYQPYQFPHDYREVYYSILDTFLNQAAFTGSSEITMSIYDLKWQDVLCEDGYYLYHSLDGKDYSIIDTLPANQTESTVTIEGFDPNWYAIQAYNDNHTGHISEGIKVGPESESLNPLHIFPNPNDGDFQLELVNEKGNISLVRVAGMNGAVHLVEDIQSNDYDTVRITLPNEMKGFQLLTVQVNDTIFSEVISVY